jgi:hypothetical protein
MVTVTTVGWSAMARIGFWDAEGITLQPDDLFLVIEPHAPAAS